MSELDSEGLHVARPGTIRTFTGLRVDPLNVTPEDISIADIAHALSLQCRYNGHSVGHLSVARHSLWVSEELEDDGLAMWGLLHDAAETYLGDMVRPLKHSPDMKVFLDAEARLDEVIAEAFGLPWPMPARVHEADSAVLTEIELPEDYGARYRYDGSAADDERDFLERYVALGSGVVSRPRKTIMIALAGPKRVGKDLIASTLIEKHGFERIAFADKLRAVALGADPYVKCPPLKLPTNPWRYLRLSAVVEAIGWEAAKGYLDVRRLLERLGTEGVRDNLGYSTWIDAAFADVKPGGRYVFTDCRFENEADAVIERGGSVWRVERPGYEADSSHVSQAVLIPPEKIDRVIVNDGSRADLRRKVLSEWTPA